MRTVKRKAIILAAVCMAAGLLISFVALAALDFNFFELGTMEPVTNTYALTEDFSNIRVWGAECDVRLLPAEDGACTVLCHETDRITHTAKVENDTLMIKRTDDRRWYEHIGFMWNYWGPIEVIIYLPERAYQELSVRTVSGEVEIPQDFSFAQAEIDATSGDIRLMAAVRGDLSIQSVSGSIQVNGTNPENLTVRSTSGDVTVDSAEVGEAFACKTISGQQRVSHVTCQSATVNSTSGDAVYADVIASENIHMEAVSGDLELSRCDADTLWLKTVSGNVTGSLCTKKRFITNTVSGSIRVPDSAAGGKCEVTTISGDIMFDEPER